MRVLVTRPEPDASRTAERLRALGHEPVVVPLLEIVFAEPPAGLPDPKAIVLTSRNAVRAVSRWPRTAGWLEVPVFATGHATAQAASRAGFMDVRTAGGNAADLADVFTSQFAKDIGPVLYPAARDRTGGLAEGLGALGYDIRMVEAYRAEMMSGLDPAQRDALATIDVVLLYSHRTAVALRKLAEREGLAEAFRKTTLVALSGRVAEALGDLSQDIRVAEKPDEDSLLAQLPRERR